MQPGFPTPLFDQLCPLHSRGATQQPTPHRQPLASSSPPKSLRTLLLPRLSTTPSHAPSHHGCTHDDVAAATVHRRVDHRRPLRATQLSAGDARRAPACAGW
eukprot:305960-Chlamydomonas_euryale.AAC.1